MNIDELYEQLTSQMTPEQVLKKLLEEYKLTNEKITLNEGEEMHPIMLISLAAMELGWEIALPYTEDDDEVIGMTIGTEEYFNSVFTDGSCDCADPCDNSCDNCDGDFDPDKN